MARDFEDHCWKDIVDEEILEIYEPYRREVRVGRNPAVLAIDLYNKAYQGGNRPVREVNPQYSAPAARTPGRRSSRRGRCSPPRARPACRCSTPPVMPTLTACTRPIARSARRRRIYHIKEELAPMPGELVIYKERASAFFGTPLIAHLRKAGADSLIIFGESTSGCVRASTVDAYSYGFHNVVVEECTYDRSMLSHKVNLFDLHHKYADVMHVDEVIEHLDGLARGRNAA